MIKTETTPNLLQELERAERRSTDFRFSSALRAQAALQAENLRRRIQA